MDEARANINLKDGIIELQGPVDFVRYYLEQYGPGGPEPRPARKVRAAAKRRTRPLPPPEPEAPPAPPEKTGKNNCIGVIRGFIDSGFFNEERSFKDVRKYVIENQFVSPDKTVRAGLTRLVRTGALNLTGKGRGRRYRRLE